MAGTVRLSAVRRVLWIAALGLPCLAQDPFVTWKLEPQLTLGEPVVAELNVLNLDRSPIYWNFGAFGTEVLQVTIVTPEGQVDRRPPTLPFENQATLLEHVEIQPGETFTRKFLLDTWYDFHLPGEYGVQLGLRFPLNHGGVATTPPDSSFFRITIRERDPAAVHARCARLLEEAQDIYGKGLFAVQELAAINDPIAIPYLVAATEIRNSAAWSIGPRRLAEMGTPEAIHALIQLAETGGIAVNREARTRLNLIKDSIADPLLRQRAEIAVGDLQQQLEQERRSAQEEFEQRQAAPAENEH